MVALTEFKKLMFVTFNNQCALCSVAPSGALLYSLLGGGGGGGVVEVW